MNILVTGSNGQLGNCLRIASKGSNDKYIFTDVTELDIDGTHISRLDITDAEAVMKMVKDKGVDVIVNCAAYTNVDAAEDNQNLAELLNATAVRNLAEAVRANDGTLIHISTDYVFGKEPYNIPCREDQKGTPTGVYGMTKLHGEQQIANRSLKWFLTRQEPRHTHRILPKPFSTSLKTANSRATRASTIIQTREFAHGTTSPR